MSGIVESKLSGDDSGLLKKRVKPVIAKFSGQSDTWTKADYPNIPHVVIEAIGAGGGGGGGGGSNQARSGGGGCGGARNLWWGLAEDLPATLPVTAGTGGNGGAGGSGTGAGVEGANGTDSVIGT